MRPSKNFAVSHLESDTLWYKDAIIYEVHVRAFADSNGDGIGDFRGLTEKLDYLQDLGVTALWLLPFYPSPLRDDGYDIAVDRIRGLAAIPRLAYLIRQRATEHQPVTT
jgi:1,4-alpha-glucan branching enzyme